MHIIQPAVQQHSHAKTEQQLFMHLPCGTQLGAQLAKVKHLKHRNSKQQQQNAAAISICTAILLQQVMVSCEVGHLTLIGGVAATLEQAAAAVLYWQQWAVPQQQRVLLA